MENKLEKKLQVRNLRISFRTVSGKLQAVRDISFDLHKGETLAIVGESGSGKSVTSKAVLGILAGNSIVEGGEILYDGQDLLKISEEDFYKLRGDKLAMIFQDPLSSLNPIMKIGKQLTEAMLLKGKARQRASKLNFNTKIELLEKYMVEAMPERSAEIKEKCAMFRKFEMKHIEMEQAYRAAHESAKEALVEIENILYLIDKNAFKDAKERLVQVKGFAESSVNPYVVAGNDETALKNLLGMLLSDVAGQVSSKDYAKTADRLTKIKEILEAAAAKTQPDFFAMGYYLTAGGSGAPESTVDAANAFYGDYLAKNFMNDFLTMAETAMAAADKKFLGLREEAIAALKDARAKMDPANFSESAMKDMVAPLTKTVDASINPIDVVKDSAACTFSGSLKDFVDRYFEGKRTNGSKQAKYDRQMAKYNRLVARGKNPDYKVAAPQIIDLELVRSNIIVLIDRLIAHYEETNAHDAAENKRAKAERLIDYLKENASGMINKVTKQSARNRAIKLMEEVGISEPRKRYNQYPFEFSGGMRQRIVIAIALAADPDVLICDEPTTALDVTIQAQILELINRLKKERNLSIIFITHDLGVVANMADRIAVMYAGKIVEYGTAE